MKKILILCALMMISTPAMAADDLNSIYTPYTADTERMMDKPHRGISELGAWLSETVAGTLQFSPNKAAQKLRDVRPLFTDAGFKSYTDFLAAQGYGDALQKQTLEMTSIVNSIPMLIGQGASAGRYAWAYEMQVVLTATQKGMAPVNKAITLRIQVGRNINGAAPMGVLIESWQVFTEPTNDSGQPRTAP